MEGAMKLNRSWQRVARSAIVVAGLVALLGGCVVYPIGYGGPPRHSYWHDRGWR
jgi:hypothetical protein